MTLRIGQWEQISAIRPQFNLNDRANTAASLPTYDRYEWFHLFVTVIFTASLYIALLFIVTGMSFLVEYRQLSIFVGAYLTFTASYIFMFVILFHFHDEIGNFFERSFGVRRSVQRKFLRFVGYLLACVLVVVLIGGHMIFNIMITWRPFGYLDIPLG